LTAYAQWTPDAGHYLLFGVAACEVEINVLTGERSILATDLIYDCGKSLNPAVDIGQVHPSSFLYNLSALKYLADFRSQHYKTMSRKLLNFQGPSA
jgi:xanthine dehydrogenase molybdopterin-binding subunit B